MIPELRLFLAMGLALIIAFSLQIYLGATPMVPGRQLLEKPAVVPVSSVLPVALTPPTVFPDSKSTSCFDRGACGYCALENGCPNDKCLKKTHCGASQQFDGAGCAPGSVSCEYKNATSKEKYHEFSVDQAYHCVSDFILQHKTDPIQNKYFNEKYAQIRLPLRDLPDENAPCSGEVGRGMRDLRDEYCWYFQFNTERVVVPFYVGAQTCLVYPVSYG